MDTIFNKVLDFRGEMAVLLLASLWLCSFGGMYPTFRTQFAAIRVNEPCLFCLTHSAEPSKQSRRACTAGGFPAVGDWRRKGAKNKFIVGEMTPYIPYPEMSQPLYYLFGNEDVNTEE